MELSPEISTIYYHLVRDEMSAGVAIQELESKIEEILRKHNNTIAMDE